MKTETEKLSYLIGRQIFGNLDSQGLTAELDFSALSSSIQDAAAGKDSVIERAEEEKIFMAFQTRMQAKAEEASKEQAAEGKKFLEDNAKNEGVIVLESGLQYKVINSGSGESPKASDTVETHYEGRLINGEVFDSSYARGESISFPVNGVIKGWQEAVQLMVPGDKWQLFIPFDLAYGPAGSPPKIGPYATLVFDIELIAVK